MVEYQIQSFGELLREFRASAGLTQEELAERAGLSVRGISDIERGLKRRPHGYTVGRLVQGLNLDAEAAARLAAASRTTELGEQAASTKSTIGTSVVDHLPIQSTSFVGRLKEIEQITALMARDDIRIVTLTGAGGVGKTRLALQAAATLVDQFVDGIRLAELGSLTDPTLVPNVVLRAVAVREQPGRAAIDTLLDALRTRHLLLVLDNCEHLLEACAALVETLLHMCPRLRILATSREPLGAAGEIPWRVPSLAMPPTEVPISLEAVAQCEAGQLLQDRARAAQPSFVLTAANAQAVSAICTRLDGIPLALELAAARLSTIGIGDLATRLDQRFRLLTRGGYTALPRQQTLRATVDWSYELLTWQERTLFARLSVFAGGWTLEAAEAVGAGEGIAPEDIPDLVTRLVDKSLADTEVLDDGRLWYRQLETLRQYGWERLAATRETAMLQHRHAAYYLDLAERAESQVTGPDQVRWLDHLEHELDNLRAALAWCLERSEHEQRQEAEQALDTGLRIAGALHYFWRFRDHSAEGIGWQERLLAGGGTAQVRAKALWSAGALAALVGNLAHAYSLLTESVTLSRQADDKRQLSLTLGVLGSTTWGTEQDVQADFVLEESIKLARALGDRQLIGRALLHGVFKVANSSRIEEARERARAWGAGAEGLHHLQAAGNTMAVAGLYLALGQIALYDEDYERARAVFGECLPMLRALGWQSTLADALVGLADASRMQGGAEQAKAFYLEALALYRRSGDHLAPVIVGVLCRLADVSFEQGDYTAAQTQVAEGLLTARSTGHVGASQIAEALEMEAALAARQDEPEKALRLASAAAALRTHHQLPDALSALERPERRVSFLPPSARSPGGASSHAALEHRLAPARHALSVDDQIAAWTDGLEMTLEQAITYALDVLPTAHSVAVGAVDGATRGAVHTGEQDELPGLLATEDTSPPPRARPRVVAKGLVARRLSRAERQAWTLEHLRTQGPLSPRAYARILGVSADTALSDLRELVDRGVIQAAGTTRDRCYWLAGENREGRSRSC